MAAQPPPWSPKQDKPPGVLHALFNFAIVQGLARENPASKMARPKARAEGTGILTATQLRRLLLAADEKLRPTLAIGGLRGPSPCRARPT